MNHNDLKAKIKTDLLNTGETSIRVESYNDYLRKAGVEISLQDALSTLISAIVESKSTSGYYILACSYLYTNESIVLFNIPNSDIRSNITGLDYVKYQTNMLVNVIKHSHRGYETVWGAIFRNLDAVEGADVDLHARSVINTICPHYLMEMANDKRLYDKEKPVFILVKKVVDVVGLDGSEIPL